LNNFDYHNYKVDLHLHSHTGPLLSLLSEKPHILPELSTCKSYRQSIKQMFLQGHLKLGFKRLYAKVLADKYSRINGAVDSSYYQMQEIWRLCLNLTEAIDKDYDVAISYLWPHHFTAYNVNAKNKIAWIHTDYSTIDIDIKADLSIWQQFDYIISISDACTEAFLEIHPSLSDKVLVVENITSPEYIQIMAEKPLENTFSKDSFNIVSVGRLCHAKGYDRAVEVLKTIHQKGFSHIKWYIVGDGGDKTKVEALIERYDLQNSFILLGSTTNPYPYMKASDLYIQPSRYEGKAVTVAEAQILAKPILITNYATSSSQINHNVDGVICEQSVDEIANSIIKLYKDESLRNRLSSYCKQKDYSNNYELNKLYQLFN